MSIVNEIFKPLGLLGAGLTDIVPGLRKSGDAGSGLFSKEMMIGQGGLSNLEKAGVDLGVKTEDLKMAELLNNPTNADEFTKTDLFAKGVEIEPISGKAMFEISDKDVNLKKGHDLNKLTGEKGFLEIFNAPLLEKAYPELEDMVVKFIDDPTKPTSVGNFQPNSTGGVLTINKASDHVKQNGIKDTVIHEVQHYVQLKEDFAAGESMQLRLEENPIYAGGKNKMKELVSTGELTQDLISFSKANQGFPAKKLMGVFNQLADQPLEGYQKILKKEFGDDAKVKAFLSQVTNYPKLDQFIAARDQANKGYTEAFKEYQRVSGEAWARNAADRMNKTQEELLAVKAREQMNKNPENIQEGVSYDTLTPSRIQEKMPDVFSSMSYNNPLASTIKPTI